MRRFLAYAVLTGLLAASLPVLTSCQPDSPRPLVAGRSAAHVSRAAVAAARELGGVSHLGQKVYLVVVTRSGSESVVAARLRQARPHFGDAQDYFVVLASDWFAGMPAGQYVAAEAHSSRARAQEAEDWYSGRVDEAWYKPELVRVTVKTDSPIPVVGADVQ